MQDRIDFTISDLLSNLVKMNQRVAHNYLKNVSGYQHDNRDIMHTFSNFFKKILEKPLEMMKVQANIMDYLVSQQEIWSNIFNETASVIDPLKGDRRFNAAEWSKIPFFKYLKENHLSTEKLWRQILDGVEMDDKFRKKIAFYTKQYLSLYSPTNSFFTNPEAIKLALETQGKSVWNGFNNLVNDLEKGKITQTDASAFEVGQNLAISPGTVVFENELIQLIQYTPTTNKVFEIPLVIIPPWINKYYVLDLQPKDSMVKYLVEHGITVFMISWRNPQHDMAQVTLDDYVAEGGLKAIEVALDITGSSKVNMLGYCLGGTLLGIICAVLAKSKNNPVNSATFMASMLDFSDIGPMGDIVDTALIHKLERGELLHNGILYGPDLETAFNLIRPDDLIWYYVINNYLKGEQPFVSDIMYWSNDNTNLPAAMYVYYMRYMILENKLSRKNALTICDKPIDIGQIEIPVIGIGFKDDIISPAKTAFITTELVSASVEYILGESGHVMGAINHPSKKKYGHWIGGQLGKGFEEWQKTATFKDESWWITWIEKLVKLSGNEVSAPTEEGNKSYKAIEAAPGKYVKEKC